MTTKTIPELETEIRVLRELVAAQSKTIEMLLKQPAAPAPPVVVPCARPHRDEPTIASYVPRHLPYQADHGNMCQCPTCTWKRPTITCGPAVVRVPDAPFTIGDGVKTGHVPYYTGTTYTWEPPTLVGNTTGCAATHYPGTFTVPTQS